jgi:hypothetical protein
MAFLRLCSGHFFSFSSFTDGFRSTDCRYPSAEKLPAAYSRSDAQSL